MGLNEKIGININNFTLDVAKVAFYALEFFFYTTERTTASERKERDGLSKWQFTVLFEWNRTHLGHVCERDKNAATWTTNAYIQTQVFFFIFLHCQSKVGFEWWKTETCTHRHSQVRTHMCKSVGTGYNWSIAVQVECCCDFNRILFHSIVDGVNRKVNVFSASMWLNK